MKNIKLFIWAVICLVVQTATCRYIGINGTYPNIVFALVISMCAMEENYLTIAIFPAVCGLVLDYLSGGTIGMYTLMFSVSSMLCFLAGERFFKQSIFFAVTMTFFLQFLTNTIFMFVSYSTTYQSGFGRIIVFVILPSALYSAVTALVIYPLLKLTVYHNGSREGSVNRV